MATLTERLQTPALTPAAARAAHLVDLRTRLENAERIAAEAEAAGDWRRFRKALQRMHLRTVQISYAEERPAEATCPACRWGAEKWPKDFVRRADVLSSCVEHMADIHGRVAAEYAQRDCAGLEVEA